MTQQGRLAKCFGYIGLLITRIVCMYNHRRDVTTEVDVTQMESHLGAYKSDRVREHSNVQV